MIFSSLAFIFGFLPIVLLFYFLIPGRQGRNIILFLLSLVFYAWGEAVHVLLLLFSIFFNYCSGLGMDALDKKGKLKQRKVAFILIVTVNLLLMGVFKYTYSVVSILNGCFGFGLGDPAIYLPVGISFYTFKVLTYLIDLYRRQVPVQRNLIKLGTYISVFPQLTAGPISRYSDMVAQIDQRQETFSGFTEGLRIFIVGLSAKVLIASNMALIADPILCQNALDLTVIAAWIGMIAYTFQVYFDFAGYSLMAIGLGKMFGFQFPANFNFPYISQSVTEFWRRWHITLSAFFRYYVYYPLGGNRVTKGRHIFNILLVWTLTGMWHGASWNFAFWGFYYGFIMVLEKYLYPNLLKKMPAFFRWVYAMFFVIMGRVFFRISEVGDILAYYKAMFCGKGEFNFLQPDLLALYPWFIFAILFSAPAVNHFCEKWRSKSIGFSYGYDFALILLFYLSIAYLTVESFNPFIYFRF